MEFWIRAALAVTLAVLPGMFGQVATVNSPRITGRVADITGAPLSHATRKAAQVRIGPFTATLIGEIRTRKNLTIVPAPYGRGDVMGNGYGVGGAYAALLIVKTVRDIVSPDDKTPDPHQ